MQAGLQPPSAEAEQEALADSKRKVIFVLERANLEVAKVGKVNLAYPQQDLQAVPNKTFKGLWGVFGNMQTIEKMKGCRAISS